MADKIIIAGGTGLIGKRLEALLTRSGYTVYIISRSAGKAAEEFPSLPKNQLISWDDTAGISKELEGSYSVINLAGASVGDKRWTDDFKKTLYESRIKTTSALTSLMAECNTPPKSFICASAIGIYGFTGDEKLGEDSPYGNDFLAQLTIAWEKEAMKARELGIRTACMRTGVVLDKEEGALVKLIQPYKFFAGGYLASGKQWFSWIHIQDTINLFKLCIENNIHGAVNVTAPEPVTNKEFCKIAGEVLKSPCWAKVPAFALKIALGEFANSLINGQRVIPQKALAAGFTFKYPLLKDALKNLLVK